MGRDTLVHGNRGADVRYLQTQLNALGENLVVDGEFGDRTFDAVCDFQTVKHLEPDGVVGPKTWDAIDRGIARLNLDREAAAKALRVNDYHLLTPGATLIPAKPSWYGGVLAGGAPKGVVCHVTDTAPGTALAMARNRTVDFIKGHDRLASWHATVETDGALVQMIPFNRVAWHAGSKTAHEIPGLGWANFCTVGIEIVGHIDGPFPEAQVLGYAKVLRALRLRYDIRREYAMLQHSVIDPAQRSDPGPTWMKEHAEHVLELAYAERDPF